MGNSQCKSNGIKVGYLKISCNSEAIWKVSFFFFLCACKLNILHGVEMSARWEDHRVRVVVRWQLDTWACPLGHIINISCSVTVRASNAKALHQLALSQSTVVLCILYAYYQDDFEKMAAYIQIWRVCTSELMLTPSFDTIISLAFQWVAYYMMTSAVSTSYNGKPVRVENLFFFFSHLPSSIILKKRPSSVCTM